MLQSRGIQHCLWAVNEAYRYSKGSPKRRRQGKDSVSLSALPQLCREKSNMLGAKLICESGREYKVILFGGHARLKIV